MTNRMGSERKMLVLCWLLPTVAVGLLLACCLRFWAGSAQSEHLVIIWRLLLEWCEKKILFAMLVLEVAAGVV